MLCEKCKKKEATVYYAKIINGEKEEQHLCDECAAENSVFFMLAELPNKELMLGGLIASILEGLATKLEEPVCGVCGMKLDKFYKSGHFGCASCYDSFGENLSRLFKSVQGQDTHVGKRPKGYEHVAPKEAGDISKPNVTDVPRPPALSNSKPPTLEVLRLRLQQAIEQEEYEEAARLRDEIKLINT